MVKAAWQSAESLGIAAYLQFGDRNSFDKSHTLTHTRALASERDAARGGVGEGRRYSGNGYLPGLVVGPL